MLQNGDTEAKKHISLHAFRSRGNKYANSSKEHERSEMNLHGTISDPFLLCFRGLDVQNLGFGLWVQAEGDLAH